MGLPQQEPLYTVEEYLEIDRASDERYEYIDGFIYAMASESGEHADICTNLIGSLYAQLRDKPCRARSKDTKVRSGPKPAYPHMVKGLFSYPDIVVVCGEPEYYDNRRDIITNPTVIIEVLSPSTEHFDRGEKFFRYQQWNPTLMEYLLVYQTMPLIEHFVRRQDKNWNYTFYMGLEDTVPIESIGCTLRLIEVYDRVAFSVSLADIFPIDPDKEDNEQK
jgi:Uma2 family endonuclease